MLNYDAFMRAVERNIRYLVIGDPVSHSRSPGLQNAAFESAGLGSPYARMHVEVNDLPEFAELAKKYLSGVNLTVPHKNAIVPLCDTVSPSAQLCQSVNTLTIRDGKLHGTSTDGPGIEYALFKEFGFVPRDKVILFLGAGGACKATAFHLAEKGACKIIIANRTVSKAEELAESISANTECSCCACSISDNAVLKTHLETADLVIQATSCGLKESDPSPIDTALITDRCRFDCFDTIYKETALLRAVRAKNLRGAGGRQMLIGQGAESFRIWTGIEPDISAMEQGFEKDISQEDTVC